MPFEPLTIYGTGARCLAVLQRLSEMSSRVSATLRVVTAPDIAVREDGHAGIRAFCAEHGVPCYERRAAGAAPGWAMAVGWRWMIEPYDRLVVLHDSLLPRYRGFAPVVAALLEEEPQIGVTCLLAAQAYDRGDIIAQRRIDVSYPVKVACVMARLLPLYAALAGDAAAVLWAGEALVGRAQDETCATYSPWRDFEDYRIDWRGDSRAVRNHINAVGPPYLGASSMLEHRLVRVLDADLVPDVHVHGRPCGKVLFVDEGRPVIICGRGLLRLNDVRDAETGDSLLPLPRFRSRFV